MLISSLNVEADYGRFIAVQGVFFVSSRRAQRRGDLYAIYANQGLAGV